MYSGPATLRTEGADRRVTVDLWSRPPRGIMLGQWGGTARGEGIPDVEAEIELPDGRRGRVVVTVAGEGPATLTGRGDPPS